MIIIPNRSLITTSSESSGSQQQVSLTGFYSAGELQAQAKQLFNPHFTTSVLQKMN